MIIIDVDECINATLNNCHVNATCNDTVGSFECGCYEGFSGDGVNCTGIYVVLGQFSDSTSNAIVRMPFEGRGSSVHTNILYCTEESNFVE